MNNDELFETSAFDNLPDWVNKPIAVFDLETTGLDHRESRIVTACAALIDSDGKIIGDNREWLADPGIVIPLEASSVHGITTQFAQDNGAPLEQVVQDILETLGGYFRDGIPVVAYNAPYDFTILRNHAELFSLAWPAELVPVIDPLVIDKKVDRYRSGKRRLEIVAAHYGVPLDDAHNATADAVAAGRIAQAIGRKFASALPSTAVELHAAQIIWARELDESFAEFMRKSGKPDFVTQLGWPEKPLK